MALSQERTALARPDAAELSLVNEKYGFPLTIRRRSASSDASPWSGPEELLAMWNGQRNWIDAQQLRCGAVLFRGFGISDQELFHSTVSRLKGQLLDYVDGNSPRTKLGGGVYTSTEYPPEYFISLHNELSYSAHWPARLFFCCVVQPDEGGQTPLVDSRALLQELPPHLVDEFRRKQVRYVRNLHDGKGFGPSWQKTFETTDRGYVEECARSSGVGFEWNADGSVRLSSIRPAIASHPITGEEVWFNQADQFHPSTHPKAFFNSMIALYKGREDRLPQNAMFGDGTLIPLEYLETVRDVTRRLMVLFDWQRGDLLMVDNMLAAHGRMPFKGNRRVLVSMTAQ